MPATAPRIGARVLLLDPVDRVLLIHARDPDDSSHHWWELPGGGVDPGETLVDTARREVAEEAGIVLADLGPQLWVRESRFRYKAADHHRIEHVFLGRTDDSSPRTDLRWTDNEKRGVIEHRWWSAPDLQHCGDKLLPANLATLVNDIVAGAVPASPLMLFG